MCLSATDSSREPEVHLGVDTKMKVLERGHGVATLNILVKDELRNTTLMHGTGKPVQGRAYTARAVPFLQAVLGDEGAQRTMCACSAWLVKSARKLGLRAALLQSLSRKFTKTSRPALRPLAKRLLRVARVCVCVCVPS